MSCTALHAVTLYMVSCSEVQPSHSCSVEEFMQAVKKSNVCIKGIIQTPTGTGKGELESVNMAMRFVSII